MKEHGRQRIRTGAVLGFAAAFAILLAICVASIRLHLEAREDLRTVALEYEILERSQELLSVVKGAEAAERGYLLTGDDRYLEPYLEAGERAAAVVATLRELTAASTGQQARLTALEQLIVARLGELEAAIAARADGEIDETLLPVAGAAGETLMAGIDELVAALRSEHSRVRDAVHAELTRRMSYTLTLIVGGAVLIVAVGGGAIWRISGDTRSQRVAKEEVQLLEERLRLATKVAEVGIWDWNVRDDVLVWDDTMYALYGLEAGDFGGAYEAWSTALHPEDAASVGAEVQAALRGEEEYDTEFRVVWPDGTVRHLRAAGAVTHDSAGEPIRMVGANWDITASKELENELSRHRSRLEEVVEERTAALRRSNQELEMFAYVASHDLQEPLRKVSSFAELLGKMYRGKLDERADRFIEHLVGGASRMQRLIQDLLRYSRLTSRGKALAPVASGGALEQALANLDVAIHESGAEIAHGELPAVQADADQLARLFQNLIGNAIKFRGDEPPRIDVAAERENGQYTFSVRDNGIGIAPEFSERIFEAFQRLHTQTEYPGTGMGLALCKKIVERHGGRIWVESEPGHGTTFFFTISPAGGALQNERTTS